MKFRNINRKFGKTIWAKDPIGDDFGGGGGGEGAADDDKGGDEPGEPSDEPKGEGDGEGKPKDEEKKSDDNKPTDREAELLKEVMKRKESLKTLKSQLEEAQSNLQRFEGIDPDEVRQMMQERKEAENRKLEEKGEWDRLKERMAEEHQAEKQSLAEQLEQMKSQLSEREKLIEELTIGHSFDSSGFIGEEMTLTPRKARIVYGSHFDVVDGQVVGYDKPRGEKDRTPLVDGKGDPLGFEDAIKRIVDADPDRDNLIRSKMKAGAGSKSKPDAEAPKDTQELRGLDRIAAGLKAGK